MTQALTRLTEDEQIFYSEIEKFALQKIGPKVAEMDESERFDPGSSVSSLTWV